MKKYAKTPEEIERPGVMLYFEIKNVIKRMSFEQKGKLLDAVLEYAENGTMPQIPEKDIALCIAWDVIKPKIDEDKIRYFDKCASRAYAAYCKIAKEKGVTPVPMAEWKEGITEVAEDE